MRLFLFLVAFPLSQIISITMDAQSINKKSEAIPVFEQQGHRGCRGLMPENTIPAMIRALELGVQTLEMDVVITADSQVVLSHEPFFNHEIATKPDGTRVQEAEEKGLNIYKMDYADVKKYDVGMAPHPRFPEQKKMPAVKPLLADVIDSVKQWCASHQKPVPFFNIETKCLPQTDNLFHPAPERFVDLLVAVLAKYQLIEKTIIQSFDLRTLKYARAKYPNITLAALIEEDDTLSLQKHLENLGFTPGIYSPAWQLVDKHMVAQCKNLGMRLIPWTVNDETAASKLKGLGVAGFITDYPDRIR